MRNEERLLSKSQDTDTLEANDSNRTTRTSKAHGKRCFLSFSPCCLKPSFCGKLSSLTKTVSSAGEPQLGGRAEVKTVRNEERQPVSKSQDTDILQASNSNRAIRTGEAHGKRCFISFFPCCLNPPCVESCPV